MSWPSMRTSPVDPHPLDEVVHAVEGAEQGGFAAARGPDERGDGLPGKSGVDILQGLKGPVEQIEAPEHDDVRSRECHYPKRPEI